MRAPYPMLWFASEAEEAVRLYTSVFPDSQVLHVQASSGDAPGAPPGAPLTIEFTLGGAPFTALNGGPHHEFNDAMSLVVECHGQDELDRVWDALLDGGGQTVQCGWLTDRFGVRWQVVPDNLGELLATPAAIRAMLAMVKLDIAALEAAGRG
ncbi:MAG: VOC family protein [Actinomycetales bacterium]|nr:VOC family protein [Actinomycetales bacterium]